MVRLSKYFFIIPAVLAAAGGNAQAQYLLSANITHSQETTQGTFLTSTGAPRPQSFGTASFVLNDTGTALSFTATIFNMDVTGTQTPNDTNDNLVNAHIHAAANGAPGLNSGVVWGFLGAPDNDNTPDDLVVTPFASGVGGTISSVWNLSEGNGTTLALQLNNILAGRSYINFHTVQFAGGEIRGQIVVVPESGTLTLLGSGFVLIGGAVIRKRRRSQGHLSIV